MKKLFLLTIIILLMTGCSINSKKDDNKISEPENKIPNVETSQQLGESPFDAIASSSEKLNTNGNQQAETPAEKKVSKETTKTEQTSPTNNNQPANLSEEYRNAILFYINNELSYLDEINGYIENNLIPMLNNRISVMNNLVSTYQPYVDPNSLLYLEYPDLVYNAKLDIADFQYMANIAENDKTFYRGINKDVLGNSRNTLNNLKTYTSQMAVISKNDFMSAFSSLNNFSSTSNTQINQTLVKAINSYADIMTSTHSKMDTRHQTLSNTSLNSTNNSLPSITKERSYQFSIPKFTQTTCYIKEYGSMTGVDCFNGLRNIANCNLNSYGTLGVMECY